MLSLLLLPDPNAFCLHQVEVDTQVVTLHLSTAAPEGACPLCQQGSTRVHSRYTRHLADLPVGERRVRLLVRVRRFRCLHPDCPRKIFTERLPSALPYARRTQRQTERLREVAFAVGCRAGARLIRWLGMGVSHDTLLRLLRHSQIVETPTPRLLGVDDFAFRRGQRYHSSHNLAKEEGVGSGEWGQV